MNLVKLLGVATASGIGAFDAGEVETFNDVCDVAREVGLGQPVLRRRRVGRLPRPDQGLGGSGAVPGAQTVVAGRIPTA